VWQENNNGGSFQRRIDNIDTVRIIRRLESKAEGEEDEKEHMIMLEGVGIIEMSN
jgi:hypothetical protein